jgi:hypothetical protein
MVALTPVSIYSTSVAAPNGIEMCAALALWTSILGLSREDLSRTNERALLYACIPGGMVLATVRFLGPLWLGLAVLTVVVLAGVGRVKRLAARSGGQLAVVAGLITVAVVGNAWWILSNNVLGVGSAQNALFHDPVRNILGQIPLWFFQGMAAFPYRNDPAPTIVYAAMALVLAALVGWGAIGARPRLRWVLVVAGVLSIVVPFGLAIPEYPSQGTYWQGRYGLPYTFGLMLLAGYALDAKPPRHRTVAPAVIACWLALVLANVVSVIHVLEVEKAKSPSLVGPDWLMPQAWTVAALMVAGWIAWGLILDAKRRITVHACDHRLLRGGIGAIFGAGDSAAARTESESMCSTDQ